MYVNFANTINREFSLEQEIICEFRKNLEQKADWITSLIEAISKWTIPHETYLGRYYKYFICEEAFDWITLSERLCNDINDLIPQQEKEALLINGHVPCSFNVSNFKDTIGSDKYRGYLNFFYGITVEEALQLAVETEVQKQLLGNGKQYEKDFSTEAFLRIYQKPQVVLLKMFCDDHKLPYKLSLTQTEHKEFTYWLFKHRLSSSDRAKVASDTQKGLTLLRQMADKSTDNLNVHFSQLISLNSKEILEF